jgi:predicted metalloprotease
MAQTKMNFSSACSYFGERLTTDIYTFSSDDEAQTALARITYASGIPTNFKLVAGNVPNACASLRWNPQIQGYDRFIIYNQTFMLRLKNATNDWAALSILAHEVGHHLSGHSLISGGSRPELELEDLY